MFADFFFFFSGTKHNGRHVLNPPNNTARVDAVVILGHDEVYWNFHKLLKFSEPQFFKMVTERFVHMLDPQKLLVEGLQLVFLSLS